MIYTQIIVHTTTLGSEILSDMFYSLTEIGACVFDKADLNVPTWDYEDENFRKEFSDEVVVKGFCLKEETASVLHRLSESLEEFRQNGLQLGSLNISVSEVDEANWLNAWKKYFKPFTIGGITVCPQWIDYKSEKEQTLKIDPGLAFGTGEHETTRMCLQLLQEVSVERKRVLDVGCGSGILGIAALLLKAKSCLFLDYDSQAVTATNENITLNGLNAFSFVRQNDLCSNIFDKHDLVLANLTANLLIQLLPQLENVIVSGHMVLSGVLDTKLDEVLSSCEKYGYKILKQTKQGCWCALLLKV